MTNKAPLWYQTPYSVVLNFAKPPPTHTHQLIIIESYLSLSIEEDFQRLHQFLPLLQKI